MYVLCDTHDKVRGRACIAGGRNHDGDRDSVCTIDSEMTAIDILITQV